MSDRITNEDGADTALAERESPSIDGDEHSPATTTDIEPAPIRQPFERDGRPASTRGGWLTLAADDTLTRQETWQDIVISHRDSNLAELGVEELDGKGWLWLATSAPRRGRMRWRTDLEDGEVFSEAQDVTYEYRLGILRPTVDNLEWRISARQAVDEAVAKNEFVTLPPSDREERHDAVRAQLYEPRLGHSAKIWIPRAEERVVDGQTEVLLNGDPHGYGEAGNAVNAGLWIGIKGELQRTTGATDDFTWITQAVGTICVYEDETV